MNQNIKISKDIQQIIIINIQYQVCAIKE